MTKVKIFTFDDLILGGSRCHFILQNQTYCFPVHTGPGFGLFFSRKALQTAYLVKDLAWKGCWGDLWDVDLRVFGMVSKSFQAMGFLQTNLILDGASPITTWAMPISKLKGRKLRQIQDFRDTLL